MMKNNNTGRDPIPELKIKWDRTRESIWKDLESRLEIQDHKKVRFLNPVLRIAMAAAFAILVGLTSISFLYQKTTIVPAAQRSSVHLPDGSEVTINAQSTLKFKPILYRITRHVEFDGEAFFTIEKGKKFTVSTHKGTISVLGTSFNVIAREKRYEVTCITGKIKVSASDESNQVIVSPSQKAMLGSGGLLQVESNFSTEETVSWIDNRLSFTSMTLDEVFREIERQYDISLKYPTNLNYLYTGTFKTNMPVEQVLTLVCIPFDLSISRQSAHEYTITETGQVQE